MHRHCLPVAMLAVAAALGGCGGDEPASAPSFEAVQLATGAGARSDTLRGTTVLFAAWATWCVPCERELPEIEDSLPELEAAGVTVIGVNVDLDTVSDADVAAMAARLAPSLTVWRDEDSSILAAYGAAFMPFSALVGADGSVLRTWSGAINIDQVLETV